jgi:hypothetical protein
MRAGKDKTRRRSVSFVSPRASVRLDITVTASTLELAKEEQEILLDSLTDQAMRNLSSAPYITPPLSKIKVR